MLKQSKSLLTLLLIFLCLSACNNEATTPSKDSSKEEWISLFNGKDLTGWDIKITSLPMGQDYKNTFKVQDSMIRISYDEYTTFDDKFGHLYYQTPYSYYLLRFEYRFTGNQTPGGADWNVRNSGIMVHSQSAKSVELNQDFPVSLEDQLLGGLGKGPRPTGNICTPGTQVHMGGTLRTDHCISSTSKTYDGDQWVSGAILVLGDSVIKHIIQGDTVLTFEKPEVGGGFVGRTHSWTQGQIMDSAAWIAKDRTPLKEGYIALQAVSHPIDFRKIELLNLVGCMDPKATNYKSYYIKADNTQCKY
jgi:hypothetical protein